VNMPPARQENGVSEENSQSGKLIPFASLRADTTALSCSVIANAETGNSSCNDDSAENDFIDVLEQDIQNLSPYLLKILLQDKTTGHYIRWACDEYAAHGEDYTAEKEIFPALITGANTKIIQPRVAKSKEAQKSRTRKSAEVFTPSWICNEMNNLCDEEWFGRKDVFNTTCGHGWTASTGKIQFGENKGKKPEWQKYVDSRRLEITCGEAPFLVSRYDTTTGEVLPPEKRIGLLDRKLRVINENTTGEDEWFFWARRAYEATYGYEYQGDNLLLARENLLLTFRDNFFRHWQKQPSVQQLKQIANIIAWNVWQMDGLKECAPFGKADEAQFELFDDLPTLNFPIICRVQNWRSKKVYNFRDLKGEKAMKFDVIIGNPPYQEVNNSNKMSKSVYPDFVKSAKIISEKFSLIMPARWMSGENGPYRETQGFIDEMLDSNHLKSFCLYPNSSDLFNNVGIKGGVCYFLWDKGYSEDEVHYTLYENGTKKEAKLSFKIAENIIIRFPELISILKKSRNLSDGSMKTLVSSRNPFGFVSDLFVKNNEGVSRISENKISSDDYLVHGLLGGKRVIRYIPNSSLKKNIEGAKAYKTFLPRANGSGTFGEVFSTPMIGTPMMICTDTFLQVGAFNNLTEAQNLLNYIKTKYFRAMVGIKKTAIFNYKDCFTFVPLQDFTDKSDIDWSKPIPEIDKQLYAKYGLSEEEISFIETRVKPME